MKLEDLTAETPISLIAHVNGEELTFHSNIQEVYPKKHFLLADPVYQDDKIITFRGDDTTVDMLVAFDADKPQLFENIIITAMKKADKSLCYTIIAPTESKGINRRESFRCFVGCHTSVKCGIEQAVYDGILRDVSMTGFAVTVDSDLGITEGQVVHAMLEDYVEELNENFSFHLYGLVVRTEVLDNGKTVYGCRLSSKIGGLENYIMKKERVRLKKSNSGSRR